MAVGLASQNQAPKQDNEAPQTSVFGVPFVRASDEHLQPGNVDLSNALTTAGKDLGVIDIPAYGFIRWLYVLVQGTGGVGAATFAADGPFNALQNIALTEPNGAPIVQFNNGYELFLANKYGGYVNPLASDPRLAPSYSASTANGNFAFLLRLPVELSGRDGLGALGNQDSAGQFKFRASLAPSTSIYSASPVTTLPTVRVRAWLSAWDQPEQTTAGAPNEVSPPALGTTSFWSVQSGIPISVGNNTIELKRKGNYLRQIILVYRNGAGARIDTYPEELRFMRDAFPARYYQNDVWKQIMFERTGYAGTADTAGGPETGVRFHDYAHEFDGALGRENRDLWQPTRGSTRLELQGDFATAGTLTVITNDVAIASDVFL